MVRTKQKKRLRRGGKNTQNCKKKKKKVLITQITGITVEIKNEDTNIYRKSY